MNKPLHKDYIIHRNKTIRDIAAVKAREEYDPLDSTEKRRKILLKFILEVRGRYHYHEDLYRVIDEDY